MEWIRIEECLPAEEETVLTFDGHYIQTAEIMWFEEDGTPQFMNDGGPPFKATHWMALPSPPKE